MEFKNEFELVTYVVDNLNKINEDDLFEVKHKGQNKVFKLIKTEQSLFGPAFRLEEIDKDEIIDSYPVEEEQDIPYVGKVQDFVEVLLKGENLPEYVYENNWVTALNDTKHQLFAIRKSKGKFILEFIADILDMVTNPEPETDNNEDLIDELKLDDFINSDKAVKNLLDIRDIYIQDYIKSFNDSKLNKIRSINFILINFKDSCHEEISRIDNELIKIHGEIDQYSTMFHKDSLTIKSINKKKEILMTHKTQINKVLEILKEGKID